ncbi:MAG: antibiotic biosynthesis monooxygenase family protein [Sporichthyaceae bacterium]
MTVTEKAEIPVKEGQEADFEAVLAKALPILRDAPGCHGVSLSRGIENPSTYLLLLTWDEVADHVAFTKTAEFGEFVGLVKDFFAGPSTMAHFAPLHSL